MLPPPPQLQLSSGLGGVQEDGAVGGQDLPGLACRQLAARPQETDAVSFHEWEDQAEGHGAPAAAGPRRLRAPQPLDAAVGHGQHGLQALAALRRQKARNQVAAVLWNREYPCG